MIKRITIREMLLLTLLAAVAVSYVRERFLPNPSAAYAGFTIDQHLMIEAAHELDDAAVLVGGELIGGFGGERMLHRGYALLDCDEASHVAIVENVKQKIRAMLVNTGWKYVEGHSTSEDWQIYALNNGTMSQLLFQFSGATDRVRTRRLGIQWAEMGFSKKWRFELW